MGDSAPRCRFLGDVEPFLRENETICQANRQNLLNIIDNPQDLQDIRLEVAAIVDAGVYFVEARGVMLSRQPDNIMTQATVIRD